jgi:hypothetical protein
MFLVKYTSGQELQSRGKTTVAVGTVIGASSAAVYYFRDIYIFMFYDMEV